MNTLILLAALSSQITFKTSQQENMTTIIPQVTRRSRVIVRFRLFPFGKGRGTKFVPTAKYPFIPANQTIDLMRLSLNINAGDTVKSLSPFQTVNRFIYHSSGRQRNVRFNHS